MQRPIHFLLYFLYSLYFILYTNPVSASQPSLTVAPAILEAITDQGKVTKTTVTLTNNTDFPLPIKAQVNAFISNETYSKEKSLTFNSASWFSLDPTDFIIQPKESKTIKVSIKPPKKTEPGGHYATIFFTPMIPQEVVSSGSTLSLSRIGVLTFLVVPGDIQETLEISGLTTKPFAAFGPTDFNLEIKNTGNVHLLPTGELIIKNYFGEIVETIALPLTTVLPGTTTSHLLTWDRRFLLGQYTATTTVGYGSNHSPLVSNAMTFWIVPWPIILIIIALLTLFYNMFIVHIDRIKLAIKVLKGKDVQESQNPPQSTSLKSSSHRRTHSSHPSPKRGHRR